MLVVLEYGAWLEAFEVRDTFYTAIAMLATTNVLWTL